MNTYEEWKKQAQIALKGASFEKRLVTKTYENINVNPIYVKPTVNELKYPGVGDHRRGSSIDAYANTTWFLSQKLNANSVDDYNKKLLKLTETKQYEINLNNFDFINSISDIENLFKNIDLNNFSVFLNSKNINNYNLFYDYYRKNNYKNINSSFLIDPLYILNFSDSNIDELNKNMISNFNIANKEFNNIKTIGVDLSHYHEAGANITQVLAFALSSSVYYLNNFETTNISDVFNSLRFSFSIGNDFFMEIAKFRAFRVLLSKLMYSYKLDPNNLNYFVHAKTSKINKSLLDENVNILRATTEAFSAIMGGVDSLSIEPYDFLRDKQTDLACRLARNTHHILGQECSMLDVIDPAGGSWYIKALTDEFVQSSWNLFCDIEDEGGMFEALKKNIPQNMISEVYEKRLNNLYKRKDVLVGTNMYSNINELEFEPSKTKLYKNNYFSSLSPKRLAQDYELLRFNLKNYEKTNNCKVKILQANFGPSRQYRTRADWVSSFFEVAGFEVQNKIDFENIDQILNEIKNDYKFIIITSNDTEYSNFVSALLKKIKNYNKNIYIMLAGSPGEFETEWKDLGLNEYINIKTNNYTSLTNLLKIAGVKNDEY